MIKIYKINIWFFKKMKVKIRDSKRLMRGGEKGKMRRIWDHKCPTPARKAKNRMESYFTTPIVRPSPMGMRRDSIRGSVPIMSFVT